ncbi:MAG: plastocyanin/azurin family copper-binding protein [Solirubrobacterales bacterium]
MAFGGGLLIGDLGGSPKTETVYVSTSSNEGGGAEAPEAIGEPTEAEEGGESEQAGAANSPGAQIFTSASCGTCHTLAAAGSTGEAGPNLNEFLAPDDTTEAVEEMIVDPNAELAEGYPSNLMPKNYSQTLSKTEVHQLAEYLVASTPAKPNPESKSSSSAAEKGAGETLHLAASATQLAFDSKELTSKPGKVTIDFVNPAALEHDVAIKQNSKLIAKSPLISEGKTSVSAELKPGTYTFFCTVPGHAEAGMEGTLVVK